MTRLADRVLAPVAASPALALVVVAAVFGALAVALFKLATPQRRLRDARGRLIGRLYEAALYQTSLPVILRVQGRLILANLRYLALALPGLAALLLPLLLVLPQLEVRFGRRPLAVGETVIVTATLPRGAGDSPQLAGDSGLVIEAGPLRRAAAAEVIWRVRAQAPGNHALALAAASGGPALELIVPVAVTGLPAVTRARHGSVWRQAVLDPAGRTLDRAAAAAHLAIAMPVREMRVLGTPIPWLATFTVVALAAGLLVRRPLRVEL